MLKRFLTDIGKDLFKFLAGLAVPVSMVFIGAGLIGLSIKFEIVMLLWIGGVVSLVGALWGIAMLLWYSGA